ncbi:hypothetical protein J5N97_014863 [Dioscorea zingiberensis]|uniref:Uncharacterized protein n=1 Tax=Dioscorea zingiberensis TaxID=325984 RepID=A0A9D5CUP1_9LILI|nr:hypothetical protein J5N97_014863 [Dioscorea zingiberensis]
MVMCQSCKLAGTWSLTGAKPMPKATVSISCKDYKNRVKYHQAFKADAGGYFYAQLHDLNINNFYLGHPLHACTVRLLSSSDPTCNLFTNINGGIEGAALKDKNKKVSGPYYEAVFFTRCKDARVTKAAVTVIPYRLLGQMLAVG